MQLDEFKKMLSDHLNSDEFTERINQTIDEVYNSPAYKAQKAKDEANLKANCQFQRYLGAIEFQRENRII
ncbi:hypothetical protein FACS189440_16870 [Bacteroidia bacterium]|nr:hypothetical protein FACS189440_16870 [Bacteroidia bacterium]